MSDISTWGGDPVIVATRAEIDRGASLIGLAESRLIGEVEPFDFFDEPVARLVFAIQLPVILLRLEQLKWACTIASENYISLEARVANRVHWITELIAEHPVLGKLVPNQVIEKFGLGALAVAAGTLFVNGNLSKMLTREVVDVYPALTGLGTSKGDNSEAAAKALQGQLQPFGLIKNGEPHLIAQLRGPALAPPTSLLDFAMRERSVHRENEASIRIDRYTKGDQKLFVVYVPGTRAKTLLQNSDPFDVGSAIGLLAEPEESASHDAVLDAIKREGIGAKDKVVMVGYSQGGTIAGEIAADHNKVNVSALVTFGAPLAQLNFPQSMPVISLEHSNDVIPALSGAVNPVTENWMTVEREVSLGVGEVSLHAHRIDEYVETARQLDQDSGAGAMRMKKKLLRIFKDFSFDASTEYQYSKTPKRPD